MARTTITELESVIATWVAANKIAGAFSASTNNLAGLLDKVGKIFTIDGNFEDKLPELDGEELPYGKTIEEWYQDLGVAYDRPNYANDPSTAAQDALKPYYPSYEDCAYSYTLGEKVFPATVKYNDYQKACNSADDLARLVMMVTKRQEDLFAQFKYGAKKELIARYAAAAIKADSAYTTGATAYTTNSTVLARGTRYSQSSVAYLCIKSASAAINKTLATLASEGEYVVKCTLKTELAIPEDTTTGEAFIKDVKAKVEDAQFASDGNSINGAAIGAAEGLILFIKKGVKPVLDVDVEAGAFNPEKIGLPSNVTVKVVDKFGDDTNKVYAVLTDTRSLRLHQSYLFNMEQTNGFGGHINYFKHYEATAHYSKNAFVHVWVDD